jgi:hypothetical protein
MEMSTKKYIERVYIAGPITPRGLRKDTDNAAVEYLYNIRDMFRVAIQLMDNGYSPFVPACDFPLFLVDDIAPEKMYGTGLAWLEKSDAILLLPYDAEKCHGVVAELEKAKELGIPVFTSINDINEYMVGGVKE